ncbi:hypothetical protein DFH28DRAFT_927099 [Melampsora americana]|nr:hypothetical protein DFH28DRAFT_927099 [Melampsora americana]
MTPPHSAIKFNQLILNSFKSNSITQNLEIDETSLDYISHLIQDSSIPKDEKIETINGILELQSDQDHPSLLTEPIENVLRIASDYLNDPTQFEEEEEEEEETANQLEKSFTNHSKESNSFKLDESQKRAIIANYGKVEDEPDLNQKINSLNSKQLQEIKEAESLRLAEEVKLLGLKSKSRKKAESKLGGDPLLRPNLNSAVVDYEIKLKREEAAKKAKAKTEKDKADLIKQREMQVKKKLDARARAAKGERKA